MPYDNVRFSGIMPALVTPLHPDETVNRETVGRLIRWHLSEGHAGFYVCGGTGEGPVLQLRERMEMAKTVREETAGRAAEIVAAADAGTELGSAEGGLGMANVISRLRLFAGRRDVIEFMDAGPGAKVVVRVPFKEAF